MSVINNEERIFKCDKCGTELETKRGRDDAKITVFIVDEFKIKIVINAYKPNSENEKPIKTNHFCHLCWDFHKEKDKYFNKKQFSIFEENHYQQKHIQLPQFEYVIDNNSGNNPNSPSQNQKDLNAFWGH